MWFIPQGLTLLDVLKKIRRHVIWQIYKPVEFGSNLKG